MCHATCSGRFEGSCDTAPIDDVVQLRDRSTILSRGKADKSHFALVCISEDYGWSMAFWLRFLAWPWSH